MRTVVFFIYAIMQTFYQQLKKYTIFDTQYFSFITNSC